MNSNMMRTCIRPGCNNPLNTGARYCSKSCAALDRKRIASIRSIGTGLSDEASALIPSGVRDILVSNMGKNALPVMEEMAITLAEDKNSPPPLLSYMTQGENVDMEPHFFGTVAGKSESYRPDDALSYDRIEKMISNGQVVFGLEMKKSWIRSAFRNDDSWRIDCSDEKTTAIVEAMIKRVLLRNSNDFMEALTYGSYFGEKVFDRQPAAYWGADGVDGNLVGYHSVEPVYPPTIESILYDKKGIHFNGFVQTARSGDRIIVPQDRSFVLTYNKRFRNLWGISILEPVYAYWAWYEIALRSLLRFLERMGTPITVCYAPSRGHIRDKDGNIVRTMKYAFLTASNVAKSNAMAIPSDVDPDSGNPLWKVDYLTAPDKGAQFVEAVNLLGTQIVRSLVIGDRTAMQPSGEAGSYGSSETHYAVTMLHNEHILTQFISQINRFLIPQLVQYNVGAKAPPAIMVTEGLDVREKERLFQLLNTMGNQADAKSMKYIDWRSIMDINNIPTLDDEEVEKLEKDALDRQRDQMQMASEFSQPPLPKPNAPKPKQPPGGQEQAVKQSSDYMLTRLLDGAQIPIILTEQQAEEVADRFSDRPRIFDMRVDEPILLSDESQSEIDSIMSELLSGIDIGSLTEDELAQLREYIMSLLGFSSKKLEENIVDLGLGDILKRAYEYVKNKINAVVKKITGKTLGEWKQKIAPGKGDVEVVTKDGRRYTWRSEDHPRDEQGRFAKKEKTEVSGTVDVEKGTSATISIKKQPGTPIEDIGEMKKEVEDYKKHMREKEEERRKQEREKSREAFAEDKWEDYDTTHGIKKIEVDGITYYGVGAIDSETFANLHEKQQNVLKRGQDLYSDFELKPIIVINIDDDDGIRKYAGLDESEDVEWARSLPVAFYIRPGDVEYLGDIGGVFIDNRIAASEDHCETVTFHEHLHGQEREDGQHPPTMRSMYGADPDEISATLLELEYAEKNGFPQMNGYPIWISWVAQAAQNMGWSKQELYDFAREAHRTDGADYEEIWSEMIRAGNVSTRDDKVVHGYQDALDRFWDDWRKPWKSMMKSYGVDWEKLYESMWWSK